MKPQPSDRDLSRATHPNVLTCEHQGNAYAVSLIPWDHRIQLAKSELEGDSSPTFQGAIGLSDRLVPVLDLRPSPASGELGRNLHSQLLVISVVGQSGEPVTICLQVNVSDGWFNFPARMAGSLARAN